MYAYTWDAETGGLLLNSTLLRFSKEPRPVYCHELDLLGMNRYWRYPADDTRPLLWAEKNDYIYRGKLVATLKGGTIYTAPEVELKEEPEPNNGELRPVDIEEMVRKNEEIVKAIAQTTIKRIYSYYEKYRGKKVDVFYVAFSGGKDSIVTLDLVQKALPHDSFKVLFGDTGMEFPDTYHTVNVIQKQCQKANISFIQAKSDYPPTYTWSQFGPPATVNRWCCSVHKTSPQILALRKDTGIHNFTGMAFIGIRASESVARSEYDYISVGEKHKGQYSCNPILDWNSAELYTYIFAEKLYINPAYKKGNRRAGCLICPRSTERSEYFCQLCYPKEFNTLVEQIKYSYKDNFSSEKALNDFVNNGGWKARKNGRDLNIPTNYNEYEEGDYLLLSITNARTDWRQWIKTIGVLQNDKSPFLINFQGNLYSFILENKGNEIIVKIDIDIVKKNTLFVKLLKNVFRKASSCILCRVCEADCHNGSMHMNNGNLTIDDNCKHCTMCHKVEKGCLIYKSLEKPKGISKMGIKNQSLNCYSHHAPKMDWFIQFFKYKDEFKDKSSLGSNMMDFFKRFLKDSELLQMNNKIGEITKVIERIGIEKEESWALMLSNLVYTPQFNWFVNRIKFNESYKKDYVFSILVNDGAKESWVGDVWSSFSRISDLPFSKVGFGEMGKEKKGEKETPVCITRHPWATPSSLVILYSLYRYAEGCGGYYQFSLSRLYDEGLSCDGVSPVRIFGTEKERMKQILNGLSVNHSDFISASFTLDLDNINLNQEKTHNDVLALF